MPLRGEGSCGGGGAPRDSAGSGATEEGEDGGVSGVSSSCGARGGFLPRHDEDLREPLVRAYTSSVLPLTYRLQADTIVAEELPSTASFATPYLMGLLWE